VCLETSVTSYQSTLRNILEERRSHLQSGESLESTHTQKVVFLFVRTHTVVSLKYTRNSLQMLSVRLCASDWSIFIFTMIVT